MYKEGQKFLEEWVNDTKNDSYENELKEYGEKEVEDMLYEYRLKFSLSSVSKSLFCKVAGNTDCPYERQGGICRSPLDNCPSQFTK